MERIWRTAVLKTGQNACQRLLNDAAERSLVVRDGLGISRPGENYTLQVGEDHMHLCDRMVVALSQGKRATFVVQFHNELEGWLIAGWQYLVAILADQTHLVMYVIDPKFERDGEGLNWQLLAEEDPQGMLLQQFRLEGLRLMRV